MTIEQPQMTVDFPSGPDATPAIVAARPTLFGALNDFPLSGNTWGEGNTLAPLLNLAVLVVIAFFVIRAFKR